MDGKEVKTVCENKVKQDLWFSVAHIIQWYVYSKMPLHFSYFFFAPACPVLYFFDLLFFPKAYVSILFVYLSFAALPRASCAHSGF